MCLYTPVSYIGRHDVNIHACQHVLVSGGVSIRLLQTPATQFRRLVGQPVSIHSTANALCLVCSDTIIEYCNSIELCCPCVVLHCALSCLLSLSLHNLSAQSSHHVTININTYSKGAKTTGKCASGLSLLVRMVL